MLVVLVVGFLFGFQTLLTLELRSEVKRNPILSLTPTPLPIVDAAPSKGTVVTHSGYSFDVPWSGVGSKQTKNFDVMEVYSFGSGVGSTFTGPDPKRGDLIDTVKKNIGGEKTITLFGPGTTKSNYAFHKAILGLTPSAMKPWMSRREAVRTSMLLTSKAISSIGGDTGLFSVQANDWKGFQFGDPAKRPKTITLQLYDSGDRHIEITFALWLFYWSHRQ